MKEKNVALLLMGCLQLTYEKKSPLKIVHRRSANTRKNGSSLYYYGARYYASWIARFVSVDPLQHEYPIYTPYQYAGNKPITYIDLDGLEPAERNPTPFSKANPLDSMRIRQNRTSNLGPMRTSARHSGFHAGHDLYAEPGENVYSINDGKIFAINRDERRTAYGYSVIVEHERKVFDGYSKDRETGEYTIPKYKNEKYYSFYGHLSDFVPEMNVGDSVQAGDLIGYTGNTGNAHSMEGINQHLHFELGTETWNNGTFDYLKKGSLMDPNQGYINVKFETSNPEGFTGTTGIIKTEKIGKSIEIKTKQNFGTRTTLGSDELITPIKNLQPIPKDLRDE